MRACLCLAASASVGCALLHFSVVPNRCGELRPAAGLGGGGGGGGGVCARARAAWCSKCHAVRVQCHCGASGMPPPPASLVRASSAVAPDAGGSGVVDRSALRMLLPALPSPLESDAMRAELLRVGRPERAGDAHARRLIGAAAQTIIDTRNFRAPNRPAPGACVAARACLYAAPFARVYVCMSTRGALARLRSRNACVSACVCVTACKHGTAPLQAPPQHPRRRRCCRRARGSLSAPRASCGPRWAPSVLGSRRRLLHPRQRQRRKQGPAAAARRTCRRTHGR